MAKKDEYIAVNNPKTGRTEYILKSELENPEKWVIVTGQDGKKFAITKEDWEKEMYEGTNMRGCMTVSIFVMLFIIIGGIVCIGKKQYEINKKHPNVISEIHAKDKRIIISDIYTGEDRMIKYDDIDENYVLPFNTQNNLSIEEIIKYSKVGDSVTFVSPRYKERLVFDLGAKSGYKNRLELNLDSINARMVAAQRKQYMDSLLKQKQR